MSGFSAPLVSHQYRSAYAVAFKSYKAPVQVYLVVQCLFDIGLAACRPSHGSAVDNHLLRSQHYVLLVYRNLTS